MIKCKGKVAIATLKRAIEIIENDPKPRKTKKKGYLTLEVGRRFRLLNKGKGWLLMSHERYNREVDA